MPRDLETEPMRPPAAEHRPESPDDEQLPPERPPAARRRSMFRGLRLIIFLIVLAAVAIGGFLWWRYTTTYESTDDAQVDGHIYPISARVGGRVIQVDVDNNQQVTAGQELVKLDPTDYQVELDSALADLRQAEADARAASNQVGITQVTTTSQISTAGAGIQAAEAAIATAEQQHDAAEARIREAQANYEQAQKNVERYGPLAQKHEISQQQYDEAVAAAAALKATVDTAKASASAAERQIAQAKAGLAQAQSQQQATESAPQQLAAQQARVASFQAAIKAKQAAVDAARLNLQYTTVRAPVAGIVGQRAVQPGQQIQPGQDLMSIVPLNDLWVTANFKETQLKNMRRGQRVTIHVDATGKDYKGHVDSFPGATGSKYSLLPPENATGNYVKVVQRLPVKIVFDAGEDPEHKLRPGMSAEPKVWVD